MMEILILFNYWFIQFFSTFLSEYDASFSNVTGNYSEEEMEKDVQGNSSTNCYA